MKPSLPNSLCVSLAALAALAASDLPGQCQPLASVHNVLPGVGGSLGGRVAALLPWDPDGSGPLGGGLVVGGSFTAAGTTASSGAAFLDLQTRTFTRLGQPPGNVNHLAKGPQNQLYAVCGQRVCRWNGVQWLPLSLQIDGVVAGLAAMPNGDLVIGGSFYLVDGVVCQGLARWQGSGWSPLGFAAGTSVGDLDLLPNGDLLVAGDLYTASAAGRLATVTSSGAGAGTVAFLPGAPAGAFAVAIAPGGDLVVSASQPSPGIFRRSGGLWTALTTQGSASSVVHVAPNGDVYVGGSFTSFEGIACNRIARFDGTAWGPLGAGVGVAFGPSVSCIVDAPAGGIVAAGSFRLAGDLAAANIAQWNGTAWSPFGVGLNGPVYAVLPRPDGDTIVAGDFGSVVDTNGARCHAIARRSNGQWFAMGQGLGGRAITLVQLPNGDVVAGGSFQTAGGAPSRNIARWDGTAWHALGSGTDGFVNALVVLPNGHLLVGGAFQDAGGVAVGNIARWDGSTWHTAGSFDGAIESLSMRSDNQVLAGGWFTTVNGLTVNRVAVGDGSSWSGLGAGLPALVRRIVESQTLGTFAVTAFGLERFDGTQWSSVGVPPSLTTSLVVLPDDSLLIGSYAIGSPPNTSSVTRYDGTSLTNWATLQNGSVFALAVDRDDQVWCGGEFEQAVSAPGQPVSAYLLQLTSACPAAQVPYGTGCSSTGSPAQLLGIASPWVGGTWRALGLGLPPAAPFVLQVIGLPAWPTPLSWILSEGQPGCDLLVDPLLLDLAPILGGASLAAWRVPTLPVLVGQQLALQHLPFAFNQGVLTGVFATNALRATVGSY